MDIVNIREYEQYLRKWKSKFNILWFWDIKIINDKKTYCQIRYNIKDRYAIIYPCDIENPEDYVLHEIVKLAMIASQTQEDQLSFIEDLCTIIEK